MKFDKLMTICYRVLAILTTCAVVVGLCFSCFAPIHAHAELSASDMVQIEEYLKTYASNQANIDFRFTDENGRSARLQINSLQQLYYNQMESLYLSEGFDYSTAPDTFSVSGSSTSGFYSVSGDSKTYVSHIYACQNGGICATSQHFNISIKIGDYNDINSNPGQPIVPAFSVDSTDSRAGVRWDYSSTWRRSLYAHDSLGFFSDYFRNMDISPNVIYGAYIYTASNSSIPVLSRGSSLSYSTLVGARGASVTLPKDSVDSATPWDYYNNTLLPYIKENFDIDNIDDFLVFPDGYNPPTDPIEPTNQNPTIVAPIIPVIIGSGNIINVDGVDFDVFAPIKGQLTIDGINFQFPIDDLFKVNINGVPYDLPTGNLTLNGHTFNLTDQNHLTFDGVDFIINGDGTLSIDGTTFNYPIGEPETMPVSAGDFVYKYEIPTLENINIVDASLESPDLSNYATGIDWISKSVTKILTDSGLLPVVIISLSISALGYALWKIGG